MKYLHFSSDLAKRPIRLSAEQLLHPTEIIKDFFSFYDLNAIRMEIGRWVEYALSSSDPDLNDANARVNLLQFAYQLEAVFEAVYCIHCFTAVQQNQQ